MAKALPSRAWEELRPEELNAILEENAIAWLPLGTLEWHGHHLPLGVDSLISSALMRRCADRFGGVVLPALNLGPDRSQHIGGEQLQGMDYDETTSPPRRLPGSAYWISEALFDQILDALLQQLARAGVEAVFADGHGPSRWRWAETLLTRGASCGLELLGIDRAEEAQWPSQTDHAGRNETSLMLATRPDLVDLAALSRPDGRLGVAGADPALATAQEGEALFDAALTKVEALLAAQWVAGRATRKR